MADQAHARPRSPAGPLSLLSQTNSLRSTILGVGSDSGRAFLALGILVLRGVNGVNVAMTFRRLYKDVEQLWRGGKPISEDTIEVILNFIRYVTLSCGSCSRSFVLHLPRLPCRTRMDMRRLWALLILCMQRGDTVCTVLATIRLKWTRSEVVRFVQYLGLIKLSLSYVTTILVS